MVVDKLVSQLSSAVCALLCSIENSSGRSRTPEHPYLRSWLL
ncbi:hypothetical protein T12_11718 [Trichinella patagoniensis]|uniref:Uncharacterized protein n=1 Tax=Trichinella patagoniensis TaxID=990121 RepID=A0A0V0YQQ0_9BILA|nr:hypothetical protein T12_11718 [Trichinella patagoniensis]